nr:MAG TPA: C2H2 type zinc-finger protein [Caudoviricetes sp.]
MNIKSHNRWEHCCRNCGFLYVSRTFTDENVKNYKSTACLLRWKKYTKYNRIARRVGKMRD